MAKVSVVIPIYNVEAYIERCVRTLFEQTLQEIEYIFVDDCTPDKSVDILQKVMEDYPERKDAVRIIRHEQNLGVSCSRIDGVKAATGKYIIHCDTDDWLDLDLYEKMYCKAEAEDADITVCDFINEYSDGTSVRTLWTPQGTPREMLENMHNNSFYCMLWKALIRRDFLEQNNLYTIPHVDLWEDVYVMLRSYYYANKVLKVEDAVYHYFVNSNSLTSNSANPKHYQDMQTTITHLEQFFSDKKDINSTMLLNFWKILAKSTLLTRAGFDPIRWRNEYKEAHPYILRMKAIPSVTRYMYKLTSISTLPIRLAMWVKELKG